MITGIEPRRRSCRNTSVPGRPGIIKSSSTMSAPRRSNSAIPLAPSRASITSKPSWRACRTGLPDRTPRPQRQAPWSLVDLLGLVRRLIRGLLGMRRRRRLRDGRRDLVQVCGNLDGEGRSLTYLAPDRHLTAVDGSDVLDNREPKSGSAVGPAAGVVDAVETLKDPVNFNCRNTNPIVGDGDIDVVIIALGLHMCSDDDACFWVRVGNGILDEVADRDLELPCAAEYPSAAGTSHGEGDPIPLGVHPAAVDGLGEHLIDVDDLWINKRAVGLESGKLNNLADQIS